MDVSQKWQPFSEVGAEHTVGSEGSYFIHFKKIANQKLNIQFAGFF